MAYVAVVKALYDYAAQDPETELSLKEDDIAYVIEKEDEDWWKAKLKDVGGVEGAVGLVPATYVEELPPLDTVRALYAYESTTAEELSMDEDDTCHVFSEEDDWLLVRIEGKGDMLGFVPKTYCDPVDETHGVEVADAAEGEAEVEAARAEEARQRELAERQRQLKLKDKVETWSVSEVDGKKKKKGTLGVGNGAVFFASDTDKSPVKQYPITDLQSVTQQSSKEISLSFTSLNLLVHCGSSDNARAIVTKLETSKEAAGEALETIEAETADVESEEEAAPEPKAVRWAPEPSAASPAAVSPATATRSGSSAETAIVLYDFDAQGDDELNVKENDTVTIVDRSDDEWWLVRNSRGQEGVVPAQYVQIGGNASGGAGDDDGYDAEEQRRHDEEEAAAAAALEAERAREREQKAEQRRAIERAAKEKMAQEEEDRQLALDLEKREVEKQIRREQKREMEALQKRDEEHRARREATRGREPPKIAKRPSANDVAAAAARLPDRGRGVPDRPDDSRPKPNPGRIRTWSDKSGQFQVDAEYLGMNGHKIRLHKVNGVIIEVPLEKMSHEDSQMIKRYEARKQRQMEEEDDVPLGRTPRKNGRGDRERERSDRSDETRARQTPPSPARQGPSPSAQQRAQQPRKPPFDWFAFFLEAGCGMDDCTRYAANFERDRIDESLLPDLDASTLRSLGLKEGDVLRVRKDIANKYAKKTPEQEAQIKQDEEYARQLQEYERGGGKGPIPQPPKSLFTGPSGKLANNTRRGRPDRKSTIDSVDPGAIAGLTDQLSKMNTGSSSAAAPSPPPPAPSISLSPVEDKKEKEEKLIAGFDDDAWTIKPSRSKPASPAPGGTGPSSSLGGNATTPAPGTNNGTDSLLAQIQALRPAHTGRTNNTMSPIQQTQTGSSAGAGFSPSGASSYGLGAQGTGQSMSAMMNQQTQNQNNLVQTQSQSPQPTGQQQYNPNGARGPLAPVASNEALLNPMQPQQTGMFVPTRGSPAQQQGLSPMATGMMPQQTGYMMPQATGYAAGFQQGYGMQASMPSTGPGQQFGQGVQQNQQNQFNSIANVPLQGQVTGMQQQQGGGGDKFAPGNIFAAMKKSEFGKPEEQQPQHSGKYDALRPLTTGYNGGPNMSGMMPQQTGMMPQQTGMMGMNNMGGGMMPQQTGMMMNQQQTGMYGGGMMPQMTGYNPYAGQNQYGQFR